MSTVSNHIRSSLNALYRWATYLARLQHGFFYTQYTHIPLALIASDSGPISCKAKIESFFVVKAREASYVQAAGTLVLAATVACLSWDAPLQAAHWSGPALWYAGIIISLTAIVSAGQQALAIPDTMSPFQHVGHAQFQTDESLSSRFRQHLLRRRDRERGSERAASPPRIEPRKWIFFVWQAPLMLTTYSAACLILGLSSVVISPLTRDGGKWGEEAKTVIVYLVAVLVGGGTFMATNFVLHSGPGQNLES